MKFTGEVRVPEVDHPGVPATLLIQGDQVEVVLEGESLGRWSLADVRARRLVSSAFQLDLKGEELTFLAEDPIDFAYRGVEFMAESWAKFKSKNAARRAVAVKMSRRGTTESKIPELREAMIANLEVQEKKLGFLQEHRERSGDEITPESVIAEIEPLPGSTAMGESGRHVASDPVSEPTEAVVEMPLVDQPAEVAEPALTPTQLPTPEARDPEITVAAARELEAHKKEQERLEAERDAIAAEKARLDEERRKIEAAAADAEKREADRVEAYRLEMARLQAERDAERALEEERKQAHSAEMERLKVEREEAARIQAQREELDRLEEERAEREAFDSVRIAEERAELERLQAESAEATRKELEELEQRRVEIERLEDQSASKRAEEAARLEASRAEIEAMEAAAAEKSEQARAEAEMLEQERLEQERIAAERAQQARAEAEKLKQERLEQERLAAEQAEKIRAEAEKLEQERQAAKKAAADAEAAAAAAAAAVREEERAAKEAAKEAAAAEAEAAAAAAKAAAEEEKAAAREAKKARKRKDEEESREIVKELLATSADTVDESETSKQLVVDLNEFEAPDAEEATDDKPDAEPALAGAPKKSGIMGAVKGAFSRGGKNHEHNFVEAPGGIGIARQICEDCGFVSIGTSD